MRLFEVSKEGDVSRHVRTAVNALDVPRRDVQTVALVPPDPEASALYQKREVTA